ncbi:MAG: amino acid ABC transporter permease [Nostocoides sp.]
MSTSVLFDAPGPRARRRHLILTVIGALVLVGILYLVIRRLRDAQQLEGPMWKPFVTDGSLWADYLIPGLIGTFKAAVLSILGAGAFGILLGLGRLAENRWIRSVSGVIVEFFRAVPVLLMMVFLYFGYFATSSAIPSSIAPLLAVVVALILYNGSVIAELVRSGVFGLPTGQREAGLSIGLTPSQTLTSIQLPQALTAMLPALVGQLVVILKDSALGTAITYQDLLTWSKTLGSAYGNTVPAYIVCAALFIAINYSLTKLAGRIQRRLSRRGRTTIVAAAPPGGAVAPTLASTATPDR